MCWQPNDLSAVRFAALQNDRAIDVSADYCGGRKNWQPKSLSKRKSINHHQPAEVLKICSNPGCHSWHSSRCIVISPWSLFMRQWNKSTIKCGPTVLHVAHTRKGENRIPGKKEATKQNETKPRKRDEFAFAEIDNKKKRTKDVSHTHFFSRLIFIQFAATMRRRPSQYFHLLSSFRRCWPSFFFRSAALFEVLPISSSSPDWFIRLPFNYKPLWIHSVG